MNNALRFIPWFVGGLLIAAVSLTYFHGIYPDEVAYKIFLERYFLSGGIKQTMTPFCSDGFLVKPSTALIPAAAVWSLVNHLGFDWLSYRLVPLAAFLFLCLALVAHNLRDKNHHFWLLLLPLTLGPALYGLLILRPEILILAAAMLLLICGRAMLNHAQRPMVLYACGAALLFSYSLIIYVHPKALYLSLAVLVAIVLPIGHLRTIVPRILCGTVMLAGFAFITLAAFKLHQLQFLTCPSLPIIQESMSVQSVNPLNIYKDPMQFLQGMQLALSPKTVMATFAGMLFQNQYGIGHLPPAASLSLAQSIANIFILGTYVGLLAYVLLKITACLLWLKDPRERAIIYLISAIALGLLVPFTLNLTKHFYEVAFFQASLVLLAALLWPFNARPERPTRARIIHAITLFLCLVSTLCLALSYIHFTTAFRAGYEGPNLCYQTKHAGLEQSIQQAFQRANISPNEPLIMDDLTYDMIKTHPVMVPFSYAAMTFHLPGVTRSYLEKFNVRYGVVRCDYLTPQISTEFPYTILERISHLSPIESAQRDICVFALSFK